MTCTRCRQEKRPDEFYVGGYPWCKACIRDTMNARRAKLAESGAKYLRPERAKPKEEDKYMPKEDWLKFRAAVTDEKWALLWDLIIEYGLRIREALLIRTEDIDFEKGILKIRVLKRKEPEFVRVRLSPSLLERTRALKTSGLLFNVSYNTALFAFKKTAKKAGLNPRYSPHSLRHCAGSMAWQATRDIKSVKEYLRHKDISTTDIYTHLSSDVLDDIVEKVRQHRQKSE